MWFLGAGITLAVVMLVNNSPNESNSHLSSSACHVFGDDWEVKNMKIRLNAKVLADRNRSFFNLIKLNLMDTKDLIFLFLFVCFFQNGRMIQGNQGCNCFK